jgi:hypothetical protein
MRSVVVVVLLAACGHSPHSAPDGAPGDSGTDGAADAGVDGPSDGAIDAMPCTAPDTDGDGVCDTQDLCPDVADPGQADLDGDHIGWMCDPVESLTMVGDQQIPDVVASIHENTFAARTRFQYVTNNVVGHSIVQVGATGAVITRSDSTAPEDAWQSASTTPWLDGPVVTPDDHVLWSRGYYTGETGDFDVATHTFTTRANGVFDPVHLPRQSLLYAGPALEAFSLSTAQDGLTTAFVDVRAGGTLVPIATAQEFMDPSGRDLQAIPGTTRALVPVRRNFHPGLQVYTQGAAALDDMIVDGAPLTNLDELEPMLVDGSPRGYCAERATQSYYAGWDATGAVVAYELPAGCGDLATDRGGTTLFRASSGNHDVISYVVAGTLHSITTGAFARIQGTTLPLLVISPTDVWQIAVDGTASLVASGSEYGGVSMFGDTIHVLEFHRYPDDPNGHGDWILTRFRSGQTAQSVTLLTNELEGLGLRVLTTVEGAALVSGGPDLVVPSQSMTPVTSPVWNMNGGIRDGRTVVFAAAPPGTMGAPYMYSEVNGTPTFTMLDTPRLQISTTFVDTPQGPTSWFAYSTPTAACKLARFTTGMTLETVPCRDPISVHVLGTRADGTILASDGESVFALTSTGAQRIGASTTYEEPILDTSTSPPTLVGWSALHGMEEFSCLAMHPERCWNYPYAFVTAYTTYASAAADSFQRVIQSWQGMAGQVLVTVVRSIGPGNFTP